MGHTPREPADRGRTLPPPAKDTKARRNRKPETTSWLRRVWATGRSTFKVPPPEQGTWVGYKLLAAALEERRDFFLWAGHRRNDSRAVLERVVMLIDRDRAHAGGADRERLDRLHRALDTAVGQLPPPIWHPGEQRYCENERATMLVADLNARAHTRPYVRTAQKSLRQEYEEWQERGQQLGKEIAEGTSLPLETKLRGLVRSMRKRGELPLGKPMQSNRDTAVADGQRCG